jgi:hypothetical protein
VARLRPTPSTWPLPAEDRLRLRALLAEVPEDAGSDDPALVALVEAWRAAVVDVPFAVRPVVAAYRCFGGGWLIGDPAIVLQQIRRAIA